MSRMYGLPAFCGKMCMVVLMRRALALIILFAVVSVGFLSCTPFIRDDQIERIKLYEQGIYRVKKPVEKYKKVCIEKGKEVRLYLVVSKTWVKVYAYPAEADFLKTDRSLMVYMFQEEFDKKIFDESRFRAKLDEFVEKQ